MTTTEQLAQLDAAIAAIETGAQEYETPTGRRVRRGDLSVLYAERRRLRQEMAGASYDVTVANFDRR